MRPKRHRDLGGPRTVALFLILLVAAAPSSGDDAAPGFTVLVRGATGEAVAGAVVTADAAVGGQRFSARTEGSGEARLVGVPDGSYLVSARSADLSAAPVAVEVVGGRAAPNELILRFAAVRESVVVSAALAARRETEAGAFVDVLPAAALEERGEWSLVEALRGVPGTLVRQDGGPGHVAHFQIRGLPASSTAVVVDGAPLRDPAAIRGDAISLLPSLGLVGVDRVEIRRSGGSTLYGSGGIGGVLQIVTRSGSAADGARLRGGLGTQGHTEVAADWGTGLGSGGALGGLSVGFGSVDISEGADGDDPFRNRTAIGRIGLRLAPWLRLSARGLYSSASVGLNESPSPLPGIPAGVVEARAAADAVVAAYERGTPLDGLDRGAATFLPSPNDPDAEQRTSFRSTLFTVEGRAGPDAAWSVRLHDLRTVRENDDGPAGPSLWDPDAVRTIRYAGTVRSAALRGELTRGDVRWMAGGEAERETASTVDPGFGTDLGQSALSAFVQGEAILGAASLRGALRAQRFSTREADLTPAEGSPWAKTPPPVDAGAITGDVSTSLALSDGFRLRGSWGRGFRAPSLYERFGTSWSSFGYAVYGDPTLAPESTWTLDLGFSAETGDRRAALRAAYFRSGRPQVIGFGSFDAATDPFGRWSGYQNTEAGTAQGVESALTVALPRRTRAGFHFTWTAADPPENAPGELESEWLIPRLQGGLVLSGTLFERLNWSADLHLTSALDAPLFDPVTFGTRVFRFAGMRRLDLAAGLDLGAGLRMRGIVRDALDDRAFTSAGFRAPGRVLRAELEWRPR